MIDLICPFTKGGKVGAFGGAGVGKTVVIMELINNIAKRARWLLRSSLVWVSELVKETTSTRKCSEAGVIDQKDLSKSKVALFTAR